MRALVVMAALVFGVSTHGQGTILFNNRTGPIDAPIGVSTGWFNGGAGGIGAWAQLMLIQGGDVIPLFPIARFRTTSPGAEYYLDQVTVTVPGIPAGSPATVYVQVNYTPEFAGSSGAVYLPQLGGTPPGGGAPIPDALLIGLEGFTVLPEPSTLALGALGAVLLLARRRRP